MSPINEEDLLGRLRDKVTNSELELKNLFHYAKLGYAGASNRANSTNKRCQPDQPCQNENQMKKFQADTSSSSSSYVHNDSTPSTPTHDIDDSSTMSDDYPNQQALNSLFETGVKRQFSVTEVSEEELSEFMKVHNISNLNTALNNMHDIKRIRTSESQFLVKPNTNFKTCIFLIILKNKKKKIVRFFEEKWLFYLQK